MSVFTVGEPDRTGFLHPHDGDQSVFCLFCSSPVLPGDKIFFWDSYSPHPNVTAHAKCMAKRCEGVIADINECLREECK